MSLIHESHDYERGGTQKDVYTPDEVVEVPCPLCGGDDRTRLYTEYEVVGISRCHACGLIYTSPRLRDPEKVYWGDAESYLAEARLIFEGKAAHHRDPNYDEELRALEREKPGRGRLLDVGCNMGMLLRRAVARGWEAEGVEPSPPLASLARERLGLTVHNCFLHELGADHEGRWDVVALSDVFEHVTEPLAMLADARRLLAPGGILYVKVPNARWNLFKQFALARLGRAPRQGVWDAYEHVVHYTHETLLEMLRRGGFRPRRVGVGRPVQVPAWHLHVGHYYQYPSPWTLDWKRTLGRWACYQASRLERLVRLGSIGYLAPNVFAIAEPAGEAAG